MASWTCRGEIGAPDLTWQVPSSQNERTYVRATRAPICCTAQRRSLRKQT